MPLLIFDDAIRDKKKFRFNIGFCGFVAYTILDLS